MVSQIRQCVKMYSTSKIGYKNDQMTGFSDNFKAKVALEALRGDKTVQQIAAKHHLHPTQVSDIKDLHAKIARLAMENDFCDKG